MKKLSLERFKQALRAASATTVTTHWKDGGGTRAVPVRSLEINEYPNEGYEEILIQFGVGGALYLERKDFKAVLLDDYVARVKTEYGNYDFRFYQDLMKV